MSKFSIMAHPETGQFITAAGEDAAFAYRFQIAQKRLNPVTGAITPITYLIKGNNLQLLQESMEDFRNGVYDSMKIQRLHSYTPFFEGQQPVLNPKTGVLSQHEGRNFYQSTKLVSNGEPDEVWVENAPIIVKTVQSSLSD